MRRLRLLRTRNKNKPPQRVSKREKEKPKKTERREKGIGKKKKMVTNTNNLGKFLL